MASLDALAALSGSWRATYELRGDPSFEADSASTAAITPILDGRFVRIDYTWSEKGQPQEGSLTVGCDRKTGEATIAWVDTWHNGDRFMISEGRLAEDGAIDVRGAYPPGPWEPGWTWRTRIEPSGDGSAWAMVMLNVMPDGTELPAVNARYQRTEKPHP